MTIESFPEKFARLTNTIDSLRQQLVELQANELRLKQSLNIVHKCLQFGKADFHKRKAMRVIQDALEPALLQKLEGL